MLATLYARALDNRAARPVLGDAWAEDLMRRIDYDFGKLKFVGRDRRTVPFRAKKLDEWAVQFLATRPDALVLHLACGLDSRAFRLDLPPGAEWIDVDQPDVIDLRRRLYPQRTSYRMIAASVVEPDWLKEVPRDRQSLVIAEGLAPYLDEADGLAMLRNLTGHLAGGEMMFDAVLPWTRHIAKYARLIRETGASFGWAIGDPHELESQVPGMRMLEEWSMCDSPYVNRARLVDRFVASAMRTTRSLRYAHRLLHYRF